MCIRLVVIAFLRFLCRFLLSLLKIISKLIIYIIKYLRIFNKALFFIIG